MPSNSLTRHMTQTLALAARIDELVNFLQQEGISLPDIAALSKQLNPNDVKALNPVCAWRIGELLLLVEVFGRLLKRTLPVNKLVELLLEASECREAALLAIMHPWVKLGRRWDELFKKIEPLTERGLKALNNLRHMTTKGVKARTKYDANMHADWKQDAADLLKKRQNKNPSVRELAGLVAQKHNTPKAKESIRKYLSKFRR